MTSAVVLDLNQGDVLLVTVDRLDDYDSDTLAEMAVQMKAALGVDVFFVDRNMALTRVVSLMDGKPRKAPGRRFVCDIVMTPAGQHCGRVLDSNYECPLHGHDVPYVAISMKGFTL